MELYGLDCVDLVVSYTIQFIFIAKKCKFSKNHQSRPCSFKQTWTNRLLRYEQIAFVKRKGRLESRSRPGKRRAETLCRLKLSEMLRFVATLLQLDKHHKHSAFGIYSSSYTPLNVVRCATRKKSQHAE